MSASMSLSVLQSQRLATFLHGLAGACAEAPYYLGGDDDSYEVRGTYIELNIDLGANFCRPCARSVARMLEAHGYPKDGSGEWVPLCPDDAETDTSQHCAWCCRLLEYTLTDEGAAQEAAHYVEHPPSWPLPREEAYHLAAIYDSGYGDDTALNACVAQCLLGGGHRLDAIVAQAA